MTFNSNKNWRTRLEEMDETALDDRAEATLPCKTCGKNSSGRECNNCGRLSW